MKIIKNRRIIIFTSIVCLIMTLLLTTISLASPRFPSISQSPSPSEEPPPPPKIQDPSLKASWDQLSELDYIAQLAYNNSDTYYNMHYTQITNIGKILTCYDTDNNGTMNSLDERRYPPITHPTGARSANGKSQNYPGAWNRTFYPGVFCASPQQHGAPRFTDPTYVIDISFNQISVNGRVTKIEDVDLANDLRLAAYCAYMSRLNGEIYDVARSSSNSCKYMKVLRYLWMTEFTRKFGFPGMSNTEGEANPVGTMMSDVKKEFEDLLDTGYAATARFVYFQDTQVSDNDARAIAYLLKESRNLDFTESDIQKMCQATSQHNILFAGKKVERPTGNLQIVKRDMDNTSRTLGNFRFKIRDANDRYIQIRGVYNEPSDVTAFGKIEYVDESRATVFSTNSSGSIIIRKIYTGRYTVVEQAQKNPTGDNVYYAEDPAVPADRDKTSLENTGKYECEVKISENSTTTITAKNRRKYVDIGGKVWDEVLVGKDALSNNVYNQGTDHLISYVKVKLIEGSKVVKEDRTSNGMYKFEKLEIDKLNNYTIEFEYNGFNYQALSVNASTAASADNANKAVEVDRSKIDNQFQTIEHDLARGSSGNLGLSFSNSNHVSKLRVNGEYSNGQYWTCGSHGTPEYPITVTDDHYKVTARITGIGGYATRIRRESINYLDALNLGIGQREQPDLAIAKDLKCIRLYYGSEQHLYEYGSRFDDEQLTNDALGFGSDEDGFNVGVKFQDTSRWATTKYKRAVYRSDSRLDTAKGETSNGFGIYYVYQIKVKNTSSTLSSTVNEIVDFYDRRYDGAVRYGTQYNGGVITNSTQLSNISSGNPYNTARINTSNIFNNIRAGETRDLYIEFEMSRKNVDTIIDVAQVDANGNIVQQTGPSEELNNITEIVSYSTTKNGRVYAGVDEDSNPGSLNSSTVTNESLYEDDTDMAPPVRLELAVRRKIKGIVFEDKTKPVDFDGYTTREGDGLYSSEDSPIQGVKVKLYNATDVNMTTPVRVYDDSIRDFKDGVVETRSDGTFELSGFRPGNYFIAFEWGDDDLYQRSVQRYKATILPQDESFYNNELWYKTENPRYSDAKDNWDTRQAIDAQITDIYNGYDANYGSPSANINITKMNSATAKFRIDIEDVSYNKHTKFSVDESNGRTIVHEINNIDFGIAERPKQSVTLDKHIGTINLTLLDGEERINAKFIPGPTITEGYYEGEASLLKKPEINELKSKNGMILSELEYELIQGSTLKIGYDLSVENTSEADYVNKNFYMYGTRSGDTSNLVEISTKNINDYMDEDWGHTAESNNWEEVPASKLTPPGTYYHVDSSVVSSEGIRNKIILVNDKDFDIKLKPKETLTSQMNSIRVLTTGEDIDLDNEAEITYVEKTGGALLEKDGSFEVLGNHIPKAKGQRVAELEPDETMSENFSIIPATGANMNFIIPLMVGIGSFATIGLGVTFIKRKVLK